MKNRRLFFLSIILLALLGAIFYYFPDIDLYVMEKMQPLGEEITAYNIDTYLDYLTYTIAALLLIAPLVYPNKLTIFGGLALILICGIIIEYGFKQVWNRPRPIEISNNKNTIEFSDITQINGEFPPRTIYSKDSNSFVSRHSSIATLVLLLAIMAGRARFFASIFLITTIILRVAIWKHFLSDCLLAIPITMLLVSILLLFYPRITSDKDDGLLIGK